jgi:hypothetical protein
MPAVRTTYVRTAARARRIVLLDALFHGFKTQANSFFQTKHVSISTRFFKPNMLVSALFWLVLHVNIFSVFSNHHHVQEDQVRPAWLMNWPERFRRDALDASTIESPVIDVLNDPEEMVAFDMLIRREMAILSNYVDGENVDAIEHFFWGKKGGISIELGAIDGSAATMSMTHVFESELYWKRIIIEGNPVWADKMRTHSPRAFAVNAAICEKEQTVHYVNEAYVSGIIEFMDDKFLSRFHKKLRGAEKIPGDATSIDWESSDVMKNGIVTPISCIPLSTILKFAKITHVNFFLLDVEGGELAILRSIDWGSVKFDVLAVETEAAFRPQGYIAQVKDFMLTKGYTHYADKGRNSWFTHPEFTPSLRPGLNVNTWNGHKRIYGN